MFLTATGLLFIGGLIGMVLAVLSGQSVLLIMLWLLTCGGVYPLLAVALYIRFAPTIQDFQDYRNGRGQSRSASRNRAGRRNPKRQSDLEGLQ